jgi:anti-anti-sigma factor
MTEPPVGTDRFDNPPDSPPAQRAVLTHVIVREDVQRVRICFSGEIDLSSVDLVDAAAADVLRSYRPRHLDLDLAEVRFLDASGISALLRCRARAVEAGCQLAVTNPRPMIYRILELTGVLAALAVTPVPDQPIDSRPASRPPE